MSEEEQKAIKYLNEIFEDIHKLNLAINTRIVLNLIKKQQKEIEESKILKDDIRDKRIAYIDTPEFNEEYIAKQKIKDKIQYRKFELQQEYKDFEDDEILQVLKELLEENNK